MRETPITREEIKDFLNKKPGYLKEGAKRLRNHLYKKGFITSIKTCKLALSEARAEAKELDRKINNDEAKVLIYDIETSPNIGWFWRAGYKQSIGTHQILKERAVICVSYKWLGEEQVFNLAWDKNQDDKFLIDQFIDVLNEADLIVAHNGDRFDLKWLKTRALIHGLHKKMLPNYKQFDTLKVAKAKLYLNSNRLDYIAKILGFEGKNDMQPQDWHNVCILNDKNALQKMLNYCITPDHKLLNENLNWVEAKNFKEGDYILGFDEENRDNSYGRNYKKSKINKIQYDLAPVYEVILSNGDKLKVTKEHKWLCKWGNGYQWLETHQLKTLRNKDGSYGKQSTQIPKLLDVWNRNNLNTFEYGYLSGILDGEGTFQVGTNRLSFAQRNNKVYHKCLKILDKNNIPYSIYKNSGTNEDVNIIQILGGLHTRLKCLGLFQPERLINKVNFNLLGRLENRNETVRVIEINEIGEKEIIKISTSSKTFICEGYPMHNCDEDVRQLEKVYNEMRYLDNPRLHTGVIQGKTKQTSPITGSINIEMKKMVTTNRGTIKYIMKDLDTDRLFEMSESNYKKYMEINN